MTVRALRSRRHYHVHTSMRSCHNGYYCHAHLPGAWHRATSSALFARAIADGMEQSGWLRAHGHSVDRGGGGGGGAVASAAAASAAATSAAAARPIMVVWHVRTGDALSAVSESALLALNRTVLSAQVNAPLTTP